ncbi:MULTISPECIES: hypothetical protein [unclassified Microcoleus]|uniref:hypothetical protein n=1 Tax=unclassified Microcoleus TaxID=2642155 RepID=UPI002FCECAEE
MAKNETEVCGELNLSYRHLISRAGHDAQEIGRFTDMGMIFVASRGGISHAEDEYIAFLRKMRYLTGIGQTGHRA